MQDSSYPDDAPPLEPGRPLGRYELCSRVGQGGMAEIWQATLRGPRGFETTVAIKVLLRFLQDDPDAQAMLLDEANVAARIAHPNVARTLDFGNDAGRLFVVMEWISGRSLYEISAAHRKRGRRLPAWWVLHVLADACAGLHAAHELKDASGSSAELVHRDVSPQNVMVTYDGIVKVVDFGVARSRARVHVTRLLGTQKGKPGYFSPEQVEGRAVDRRSDVFSMGIVLHQLLTGIHPFRADTLNATMQAISRAAYVPPSQLAPDLPPEVDAIVSRALQRDPGARFATTAEIEIAIESLLASLGVVATQHEVAELIGDLFPDAPPPPGVRPLRARR